MALKIFADFFVFLLGICVGSFLNCVIYRLEQKKKLSGRSFCPRCRHILAWKDLVPVFSFVFLAGKCRYCGRKILAQYPIIELATALIFVLIFNFLIFNFVNNSLIFKFLNAGFLFYIASALIVIFAYDLKRYLIPDKVLLPAIGIALAYRLFYFSGFFNFLGAAIIAGGIILMILKKKGLKSEIPFGPFLVLGTFLALFWGNYIANWYLNAFKL